jgi:hypothetical protein
VEKINGALAYFCSKKIKILLKYESPFSFFQ